MEEKQIILASASPRRRELLTLMGLAFQVMPSQQEEIITGDTPEEIVENLSRQKAEDVARQTAGAGFARERGQQQDRRPAPAGKKVIVIGSDTIVVCGGRVMGKPGSEEEAFAMLRSLQGRTHEVYTGVTIACVEDDKITYDTFSRKASVTVHGMDDTEIWEYIRRGESMDKAGAYGIQGSFAMFVDEISGEYNTVLGLPVAALYQELKKF